MSSSRTYSVLRKQEGWPAASLPSNVAGPHHNHARYDGFGNLLNQTVTKGSAPSLAVNVDGNTNRIITDGYSYDANGNLTAMPLLTLSYDVENRLAEATHSSVGTDWYGYDAANRRVWKREQNPYIREFTYFYGVDGQLLGTYGGGYGGLEFGTGSTNVWFGSKLIWAEAKSAVTDRLGSVVNFGKKYYPYGEEPATTQQNHIKFATYYRDETTALDYAVNRYYGRTIGRFLSVDRGPSNLRNPQSWNRYNYVQNDPVNHNDPSGLNMAFIVDGVYQGEIGGGGSGGGGGGGGYIVTTTTYTISGTENGDPFSSREVTYKDVFFFPGGDPGGGGTRPPGGGGGMSQQQTAVNAAMRASDRLFDSDCAGMFLSPEANTLEQRQVLSGQLQNLADQGDVRVISPNALPQGTPSNVPAFTTGLWGFIYVVSGRSFFTNTLNGQPLGGPFQGLSRAQTQELIIIHEFLHWEGIGADNAGQSYTLPNGDTVTGSQGISEEVRKKCFK